ncbi:hypothetical protein RchiOBHm_Chr1g0324771 [Rosa chinensis]|uniref:Uncharacterized protein n=1 Tax=Rosa chinensis TaxID=74649 RepID=A0A2P6S9X5_ROSCH|nr:hypothetical protein RchiOBHm_Chr1g0324771 [Rosa chinensis]
MLSSCFHRDHFKIDRVSNLVFGYSDSIAGNLRPVIQSFARYFWLFLDILNKLEDGNW